MEDQTIQFVRDVLRSAPEGIYAQKEPVKEFYSCTETGVADVLEQSANEGYQALFIPELAKARIGTKELWQNWYVTPSLRATGTTNKGAKVIVYAHVPNYFSDPANVRKAIKDKKLVNGAGIMPQEAFDSLVDQDGNGRVFVIPYETLEQSTSGVISVDSALEHPQTIPFLGGEDIARAYLIKHREVNGDKIGIWHSDDLNKKGPLGRVLCLGSSYSGGLLGDYSLDSSLGTLGRVLAVVPEAQVVAKNLEAIVEK